LKGAGSMLAAAHLSKPSTIADRVAWLRESHGETLREAAARTGVHYVTINRIERGAVSGSFGSTLRKIASGYGVSLHWLLTGKEQAGREERAAQAARESVERIQAEFEVLSYVAARHNQIPPERARALARAMREHLQRAIIEAKRG